MLEPTKGALWSFYNSKLAQLIVKEGSHYAATSGGTLKVSQTFLDFFNRAADLSNAFYPSGSSTPRFSYTLKQLPSNVDGLVLKIGNEMLSGTGQQKAFAWAGNSEDILVTTTKGAVLNSYSGTWAVFRFVADAHSRAAGPFTDLEWIQQSNGHPIMIGGRPESYDYQLQVAGFNPFRAAELSGLRCVPTIVH